MNTKYEYTIDLSVDNSAGTLILRKITPGSRVLEFGPASGYMTRYMTEELGCSVVCIEIDPNAAKVASNYCEKMIVTDLDLLEWEKELTEESFDHLIFADVLEHLRDPWKVLKQATNYLKPEGTVITSIPNVGHSAVLMDLLNGRFDYRSLGLLDNTHIRFFTRKSVLELLDGAGLCPVNWFQTLLGPEETEFKQPYTRFPEEIQQMLINRTDSHVYQFVTVSQKKEAKGVECLDLAEEETLTQNGYLQVYWQEGETFSDKNSVKVPLQNTLDSATYDVKLPAGISGQFRIDPVNHPAYVEFESIDLYRELDDSGKLKHLVNWSADSNFAGIALTPTTQRLTDQDKFRLIFVDSNPQMILLDNYGVQSNHPMVLRITMKVADNLNQIYRQEINRLQDEVEQLNAHIEEQAVELKDTKITLLDKEQHLERIIHSDSWILLNRIKLVGRMVRKLMLTITGAKQALVPHARIRPLQEKGQGVWEAFAVDPQFLLKGPWPTGWTEVSWTASSDYPLRLRLYFDRGRGFNDMESLDLGFVYSEQLKKYKVIIPMGYDLRQVRLDPGELEGRFELKDMKMVGITRFGIFLRAMGGFVDLYGLSARTLAYLVKEVGQTLLKGGIRGLWQWAKNSITPNDNYKFWLMFNTLTDKDMDKIKREIKRLGYKPTFSIIMPVYNVEEKWLRKCINSVQEQLYPHWELCIADDASTDPRVRPVLEEYAAADPRIKVVFREKNGHISAASNSALELVTGDFIALLDNDDELTPDALYENAALINRHPQADMIYSDEDKITEAGERTSPFFKPDWSPDTFLSQMYTCHLGVYRTKIIREIGGFRLGVEGSQDYDLVLRFTEKTKNIYHIPKILYHWRMIAQSTAGNPESKGYAFVAGEKALQDALERRGEGGWVEFLPKNPGQYLIHHSPKNQPLVSIVIPTRDMHEVLEPCLQSIFQKTSYMNYEVVIVDNGSSQRETLALFEKWQRQEPDRFRVLRLDIPFNYSKLNNEAVKVCNGELILLLNNDVEVITPEWLEEMAGQALRPSVGAVGAMLLYHDNTIQHFGVTLGIRGVAAHTHRCIPSVEPGYFGRLLIVANYAAVTGACLMIKKELFEQVGGLEESLQVAFNDVDFCLKLLDRGLYNVVLPQVKLYHYESKTRGYEDTPEKMERFLGEINYMKERWGHMLDNDPFYNPNLTLENEDYSIGIVPRK